MNTQIYKCSTCGRKQTTDFICRSCQTETMRLTDERMEPPPVATFTKPGGNWPMISNALAISPDQIHDAKRRFPHHNFRPDGAMIINSLTEYNRVLKDLGYADKNKSRTATRKVYFVPK